MAAQRSSSKSSHQSSLSDIVGSINESSTRSVPTPSKRGRTANVFAELFSRASSSQPRVIAPQLLLGTRTQPTPPVSTHEPPSVALSSSPKIVSQLSTSSSTSRTASPRPTSNHARSSSPKPSSTSSQTQANSNSRSSSPKPTTQSYGHSHGSGRRGGHNGSITATPTSSVATTPRSPLSRGGAACGKRGGSTRGGGGARRRGAKGRRTALFKNNPLRPLTPPPESRSARATIRVKEALLSNGQVFRVGDIVSFIDEDDKQPYYAQIIGLLEDEKVQRSCVVRWLIPSAQAFVCPAAATPANGDVNSAESANSAPATPRIELKFALDLFRPGPAEELPRLLECANFVCRADKAYYD